MHVKVWDILVLIFWSQSLDTIWSHVQLLIYLGQIIGSYHSTATTCDIGDSLGHKPVGHADKIKWRICPLTRPYLSKLYDVIFKWHYRFWSTPFNCVWQDCYTRNNKIYMWPISPLLTFWCCALFCHDHMLCDSCTYVCVSYFMWRACWILLCLLLHNMRRNVIMLAMGDNIHPFWMRCPLHPMSW